MSALCNLKPAIRPRTIDSMSIIYQWCSPAGCVSATAFGQNKMHRAGNRSGESNPLPRLFFITTVGRVYYNLLHLICWVFIMDHDYLAARRCSRLVQQLKRFITRRHDWRVLGIDRFRRESAHISTSNFTAYFYSEEIDLDRVPCLPAFDGTLLCPATMEQLLSS